MTGPWSSTRERAGLEQQGLSLDSLGRPEEAARCFDKALELDPKNAASGTTRATSSTGSAATTDAIGSYDKALELDPKVRRRPGTTRALSLAGLGRHEEAVRCYRHRRWKLDPKDAAAWYSKGDQPRQPGPPRRGDPLLRQGAGARPEERGAPGTARADILNSLGRHEEAIRCFDKALELDPKNAAVWYNKGVSLAGLGRHEEAIRSYDKALELDPKNAARLVQQGQTPRRPWPHTKSGPLLRQSAGARPEERGRLVQQGPQPQRASAATTRRSAPLTRPWSSTRGTRRAWYNKGDILNRLGRNDEAIRSFDKALELNPRNALAWYKRGGLSGLGRHDEAVRSFDKALELDPTNAAAWHDNGLSLDRVGPLTRRRSAASTERWSSTRRTRPRGTTKDSASPAWAATTRRFAALTGRWSSTRGARMPGRTKPAASPAWVATKRPSAPLTRRWNLTQRTPWPGTARATSSTGSAATRKLSVVLTRP